MHTVDAHGGFPPSSAATAVPLWRFIPSNSRAAVFPAALFSSALILMGGSMRPAVHFGNAQGGRRTLVRHQQG
ncbi:hypothetical protein NGR_b01440 (plasmid) [Sinorhizobium fredii NGR234]|uniref:Uncharacterized protein n=1 Tax=Sinorhizobium fredii (strain NBRC 101917 / NGR234) TaxID=394 RepID=C3KN37_SINFN|nr:hypothetical protein NGR_b01440 [Sinorhizobium fredii NGR234]